MKLTVALILSIIPGVALASGGYEALFAVMGLQLLLFVWPLVLPLFFLSSAEKKRRSYLVLLICIYGIIGLLNLPVNLSYQLAPWFSLESVFQHNFAVAMCVQTIAFIASIIVFKRHGASLRAL